MSSGNTIFPQTISIVGHLWTTSAHTIRSSFQGRANYSGIPVQTISSELFVRRIALIAFLPTGRSSRSPWLPFQSLACERLIFLIQFRRNFQCYREIYSRATISLDITINSFLTLIWHLTSRRADRCVFQSYSKHHKYREHSERDSEKNDSLSTHWDIRKCSPHNGL